MKIFILLLFFNVNQSEPGAKMIVQSANEAAFVVWQQTTANRPLTAKLYEVTTTPAGVVEVPIPAVIFGPVEPALDPVPARARVVPTP